MIAATIERRCARLKNHVCEPICPLHKIAKAAKGKRSKDGTQLLFCALCRRAKAEHDREQRYRLDVREEAAFRKIGRYLAEQAQAVEIRRKLRYSSYQSPLGADAIRQPTVRPTRCIA